MSAGTRVELAQQSGASAFLAKPFDITALLACVSYFLGPVAGQRLPHER
jgi:DNA-binding response OmpR family regulator